MRNILKNVASNDNNPKWSKIIKRENKLYSRGNDLHQAVIYYISGMTDNYAVDTYNKIVNF